MEFLDISDVETCVRELARFHAHARARPDPDADAEAAVALVSTRRVGDFVADVAAGSAALFKAAVDREVEGAFVLLLSLLPHVRTDRSGVVARILGGVTSATDRAALRLRICVDLFNAVPAAASADKEAVFVKTVQFAYDTGQVEAVLPFFPQAAAWHAGGIVTDASARALYLLFSRCCAKVGDGDAAQAYLIRYLTTFEGATPAQLEEAKEHAKAAAMGYIRAPVVSQRSALPHLAAVRALSTDARYGPIYALVDIFAGRSVAEFDAFHAAHGALFESEGIDVAASRETMRLLTLCSLAAAHPVQSCDAVAAALCCPVAEVESWVIKAIARGLVDARIDHAARTVTVTRTVQREAGGDLWRPLATKLAGWRDSISALLATVEAVGGPATKAS